MMQALLRYSSKRQLPRVILHSSSSLAVATIQPFTVPVRGMAGHNKWSKIKRKKAVLDTKRATMHGKAAKAIIAASKACGGDLSNLRLQSAIHHAKSIQLPKDRIQESIDKHSKKSHEEEALVSMRYDAIVPVNGVKVAFVIMALTDNRNRTAQQVRALVTKSGGELLPTSKLDYLFQHVGHIYMEHDGMDEDVLLECALEAGAEDVDFDNKSVLVTTHEKDLWQVVTALRDAGYVVDDFEHRYVVDELHEADIQQEGQEKLESFLEKMDDLEDVANVYHNATTSLADM